MFVERFVDWANASLENEDEAQAYLRGRGISAEQWARHKIGYVSGDFEVDPSTDPGHGPDCFSRDKKHLRCDSCRYRAWSSLAESEDPEDEDSRKVWHAGRRIRGCVVFPLTSYSGTTIGFQVRSIREKSYDTFALKRRPEGYFFGTSAAMQSIWETGEVYLLEGPGDALVFERLVAPNSLALTTSAVSKEQLRFLRRFVHTVNLVLDLDKAGRDGVASFIRYNATAFRAIRDVKYPRIVQDKDKDPGDYWKRVGDQRFTEFFKKTLNH